MTCYKCGRKDHYANECWFLTDTRGNTIAGPSAGGRRSSSNSSDYDPARPLPRRDWREVIETIESHIRGGVRYYIGRTSYPQRRINKHGDERGLEVLHEVFRTHDRELVNDLEEVLIARYRGKYRNENLGDGGEGGWGPPPFIIYVAIGR